MVGGESRRGVDGWRAAGPPSTHSSGTPRPKDVFDDRGRSPGSRVDAGSARPSRRDRRQWTMDGELAAYSCGGSLGIGGIRLTEFPLSSGRNPENLDRAQPIRPSFAVKPPFNPVNGPIQMCGADTRKYGTCRIERPGWDREGADQPPRGALSSTPEVACACPSPIRRRGPDSWSPDRKPSRRRSASSREPCRSMTGNMPHFHSEFAAARRKPGRACTAQTGY
jgi:hypothetical protein